MKRYNFLLQCLFVFLISNFFLFSQVTILVQGKITDKKSKSPIGTKIHFIDSKGKSYTASSNSSDGSYQLVLPSASFYDIMVEGYLADTDFQHIEIPSYSEYTEIGRDAALSKIESGLELFSGSIFEKNSSNFQATADSILNYLKFVNKSKNGLVFKATLSSSDSYFPPKSQKEKYTEKGKNKTRTVKISSEEQLGNLIKERKNVLTEKLKEFGINPKNVVFEDEIIVKKPMPKVKVKSKNKTLSLDEIFNRNLVITIDRIMKL